MAHWFHRNPIKATADVGFELKGIITSNEASKISAELRLTRINLLELLRDPNNELQRIEEESGKYLGLLMGFLYDQTAPGSDAESKLRPMVRFSWSNSVLGLVPFELNDAWFEALSMLVNIALWLTKHAAKLSGKDEVKDDEAKEVHRCLRRAAGLFAFVTRSTNKLKSSDLEKGSDLDPSILHAYTSQTTAEAQEVTVARAVELKHSPSLISALAYETSNLFKKAGKSVGAHDQTVFEKWYKYLELKENFYMAYAYSYRGETVLAEDKCGDGIRCLRESLKHYENAENLCKEYAKAKGPGTTVKPENHMFFRRLRPILDRTLAKCERENGMIYHQKVPEELPELELKATYGLAEPENFALPQPHDLWNPGSYAAFNLAKASMPDFSGIKKGSKELKPVKEIPVYQKDSDHDTFSGCTIS